MPDNDNEQIKYSFEGDSSSLQKATQEALACFSSYEQTLAETQNKIAAINQTMTNFFGAFQMLLRYLSQAISYQQHANDAWGNGSTRSTEYSNALMSASMALSRVNSGLPVASSNLKKVDQSTEKNKINWKELLKVLIDVSTWLKSLKPSLSNVTDGFRGLEGAVSSINQALKTYLGIDVIGTLQKSADAAMEYIERLNLFTVVMGSAVERATEFVNVMQDSYGLDASNIMKYASSFQALATASDVPIDSAERLSTGLTALATDVSSLYNIDVESAFTRLRSAMLGMQKSASQLGADIRVSTLQFYANSLGIDQNVESMSEANRQGLRYIALIDQLSFAQGDWAKTIESPANQLRILKEQLVGLSRALGNTFLGALQDILPYINGFVMALKEAVQYIAELFGYVEYDAQGSVSSVEDLVSSTGDLTEEAKNAAKAAKSLLAPFDELNVLKEDSSSSGSEEDASTSREMDPAIVAAIESMTTPLENVRMKAHEVRDALLEVFNLDGGKLEKIINRIKTSAGYLRDTFQNLKTRATEALNFNSNGDRILGSLKGIVEDLWDRFDRLAQSTSEWASELNLEPITSAFASLSEAVRAIFDAAGDDFEDFYNNFILPFGTWTIEEAIPDTLNAIADALSWFADPENQGVRDTIIGVAGAIAILAGVVIGIVQVVQVMRTVSTVFKTVRTAISAFSGALGFASAGPVVWIIIALVALIAIIIIVVKHFDEIKAWFESNFPELSEELSNLFGEVKEFFQENSDKIRAVLKGLLAFIAGIISAVISLVLSVITNVLRYINDFIKYVKRPFEQLGQDFKAMIEAFANGDWKTGFKMLFNVAVDLVNGLLGIILTGVNFFLDQVEALINAVGSAAGTIGRVFGEDDWGWSVDLGVNIDDWQLPRLATGGVVTGPTIAEIGEGRHDEAVIPLGSSPQLNDLLDRFADKVNNAPVNVRVNIGGKDWDAFTYKSYQRGESVLGAPQLGGNIRG